MTCLVTSWRWIKNNLQCCCCNQQVIFFIGAIYDANANSNVFRVETTHIWRMTNDRQLLLHERCQWIWHRDDDHIIAAERGCVVTLRVRFFFFLLPANFFSPVVVILELKTPYVMHAVCHTSNVCYSVEKLLFGCSEEVGLCTVFSCQLSSKRRTWIFERLCSMNEIANSDEVKIKTLGQTNYLVLSWFNIIRQSHYIVFYSLTNRILWDNSNQHYCKQQQETHV